MANNTIQLETADTALCILMSFLEMVETEDNHALEHFALQHGIGGLRLHILTYLAPLFDDMWEKYAKHKEPRWGFDCEFVPTLLRHMAFNDEGKATDKIDAEVIEVVNDLQTTFE